MSLSTQCFQALKPIVDRAMGDPADATIVACKDQILEICEAYGMLYEQVFHCKAVGIHPKNRDSEGFVLNRAHGRGKKIKNQGFSKSVIANDAIAVEDHPIHKHVEAYTLQQCKANPDMAQYREGCVKIGPLGATHANQWIACVHDETPCDIPGISEGGRMSRAMCCKARGIAEAVDVGITWKVLRWPVEEAFPMIPSVIQRALNATSQMGEGESWTQNLLQIVEAYKQCIANPTVSKSKIDAMYLAKVVLKSDPPRADDVPDLVAYCLKWGGLPDGIFVKRLSELIKAHVPSDRLVSGSFFRKLADLKFPPSEFVPEFMNAVVFTHAAANTLVTDKYARYITLGECDQMGSKNKRQEVLLYNGVLKRAMQMLRVVSNGGLSPTIASEMEAEFLTTCIRHYLRKKEVVETYRSVDDIVAEFSNKLCKACDPEHRQALSTIDEPSSIGATSHNVVTYNDEGVPLTVGERTLENLGFKIGHRLYLPKDTPMKQWKLVSATNESATLASVSATGEVNAEHVVVSLEDVVQYKVCEKIEIVEKYHEKCINMRNIDFLSTYYKSMVVSCLASVMEKHCEIPDRFLISKSPLRCVHAKHGFNLGKLVIAPATNSVSIKEDAAPSSSRVFVASIDIEGAPAFNLCSPSCKDACGPMFMLRIENDETKANMKLQNESVAWHLPAFVGKQNKNPTVTVSIPCAVNTTVVKEGEELVLYRPKIVVAQEKKRVLASVDAKNKKAKA